MDTMVDPAGFTEGAEVARGRMESEEDQIA